MQMLKKILALIGLVSDDGGSRSSDFFYRPYRDTAANHLYNLLFCDNANLFRAQGETRRDALDQVLAKTIDREILERIGNDVEVESRIRVLAFNRLRAMNFSIPRHRLLGMIAEVPQRGGLDTLAAFVDGRVRYINQSGKLVIMEPAPANLNDQIEQLTRVSQILVNRIGPWDKPRRPPPMRGAIRMTFLVSDGLYFCEGPASRIKQDPLAAPVLLAFTELLLRVTATTRQGQN